MPTYRAEELTDEIGMRTTAPQFNDGERVFTGGDRRSKTAQARDIGPLVYFIRSRDDLIKIGYTADLANRCMWFGGWSTVLAIVAGATMADEHALHERFAESLARGREYFHPTPDLIGHINEIRGRLGVPAIAAR